MDCLNNLSRCKANCCKVLGVHKDVVSKTEKLLFEKAGVKVRKLEDDRFLLILPIRCAALSEDDKCDLHGTGCKPSVCRVYDGKPIRGVLVPEHCLAEEKK